MHDRSLDRTTTGSGIVGTHTLKHLKSLDAGSWFGSHFEGERIPALDEVFEELPADFPIYVEIKARGPGAWPLTRRVVDIIRSYERFESTMVASFNSAAVGIVAGFRLPDHPRLHMVGSPPSAAARALAKPANQSPLAGPRLGYSYPGAAGEVSPAGYARGGMAYQPGC